MVTLEYDIERLAQQGKSTNGLQTSYSHEDAKEEEDGIHIDAREHLRHTLLGIGIVGGILTLLIENLCDRPEHTQYKQDAYERRQMGNRLKDRYEDQTTNAKEEN